tara:strand:+ start:515 stop:1624 length:1110 start_codon:yes stop_codon:yes gene_type:complete
MAWYDDVLKTVQKPFEGVGDAFSEMNLLGASVPESFEMMKSSGLLGEKEYQSAVDKANARGTRNALLKGLIAYGTQDFNKGYGSALDARYLRTPALVGMNESQKALDRLPKDVATQYQMAGLKRTADDAATKAAYVTALKSGKYGEFTEAQMDAAGAMSLPQLVDLTQGQGVTYQNVVKDGKTQRYAVPKGKLIDENKDGIGDNWQKVGDAYTSREQQLIPAGSQSAFKNNLVGINAGVLGFEPTNPKLIYQAASDMSNVSQQFKKEAAMQNINLNDADSNLLARQAMIDSKAFQENNFGFDGGELYDTETYLKYIRANKDKILSEVGGASQSNNQSSGEVIQLSNGNIFKTGVGELKLLPDGTYQKVK